ncbi:peptidase [Terricaulis sp.]|uniref:peptidase n=1 Tax=Terricaulis sp. TaxID=2768686 RepID=UPI003782E044
MTYCVALLLDQGIVMLSDTRTNAGVDNIATFSKLAVVERPGERVIAVLSAGNLAITQAAVTRAIEGASAPIGADAPRTLANAQTMFEAARVLGEAVREVYAHDGKALEAQDYAFDANFLIAGQIKSERMRLFQVYSAGNFIESTPDTPFFQIGEHKYGKPILDRVARFDIPLEDAVKLACISLDSTLRSNLTVGLPADIVIYRRDALKLASRKRILSDDPYFNSIREGWSHALRNAYRELPPPPWPMS